MKISLTFIHTSLKYSIHFIYISISSITIRRTIRRSRFSINREGIVFKEDVRLMQQQRISVQMQISSTRSPAISTKTFIIDYTYQQLHIPFDFNGLEGTITSTFKFHYWGSKAEEILEEDIIHMVDIIIIENPEIMGMDVNEPVTIDNKIII
ncbi:C1 protein [Bhendi yellow vein India betasatellite [India:Sonipat:EL12:2006]]|nr:C1 protein [Bhendi yellow vein India betasatellite [India:Sonipat:EL12:2006]]